MTSMRWTWKEFWDCFEMLEDERKTIVFKSFYDCVGLTTCSVDVQFEIFRYAPSDVLLNLKHIPDVKVETRLKLEKELNKKSKNWQARLLGG